MHKRSRTYKSPLSLLKLESHLDGIAEAIARNDWTHIQSPTGSGKSLGVPFIISSNVARPKVFIAVPTITAVHSLHRTFCQWWPDIPCGFSAEGKVNYDCSSLVVFATTGHVLRLMLSCFKKRLCNFCDVLVVDEVHNLSIDNFMIIELWQRFTSCRHYKFGQRPRLVTMSSDRYSALTSFTKTVTIDIPQYPIETVYHQEKLSSNQIIPSLVKVVKEYCSTNPINPKQQNRHVLVFVHGVDSVSKVVNALQRECSNSIVISAYGGMSDSNLKKIYDNPPSNQRKIIVATNVAETSITVEDVAIVFDSMLEKVPTETDVGSIKLVTTLISKASANQRRGRTGRTGPGKVYRMITKEEFEGLSDSRQDEIHRCSINTSVLQLLNVGIDVFDFMNKASKEKINSSINLLLYLRLIDRKNDGYQVSEAGRFVTRLPLGIRTGTVLYYWIKVLRLPALPCIAAVVFIDRYDGTYFNLSLVNGSSFSSYSDIGTFLHLFLWCMNECHGQIISDSSELMNIFSKFPLIKTRRVVSALLYVSRLSQLFNLTETDVSPFNVEKVVDLLCPILAFVYGDRLMKLVENKSLDSGTKEGSINHCLYRLGMDDSSPTIFTLEKRSMASCINNNAPMILSLCSVDHDGKNVVAISAPVTVDHLSKAEVMWKDLKAKLGLINDGVSCPFRKPLYVRQSMVLVKPIPNDDDIVYVPTIPTITLNHSCKNEWYSMFARIGTMPTIPSWNF